MLPQYGHVGDVFMSYLDGCFCCVSFFMITDDNLSGKPYNFAAGIDMSRNWLEVWG